jgi:hypothetical protein
MELIKKKIGSQLKNYIKENYSTVKKVFDKTNNKINYVNIYHRSWTNYNKCDTMIMHLKDKYLLDTNKLISLGFISAPINCDDQFFHIDYKGNTNTYFIPLIDLNDKNGTEYIEFNDKIYNISLLDKLNSISNKYISKDDVIKNLNNLDIKSCSYKFKYLNANKWSMVQVPYYCFHRGKTNNGLINRVMFQMVFYKDNISKHDVPNDDYYNDAELDDEKDIILENRKKLVT